MMLYRLRKSLALCLVVATISFIATPLLHAGGSDEPAFTGGSAASQSAIHQAPPSEHAIKHAKKSGRQVGTTDTVDRILEAWLHDLAALILRLPR